MSDLSPPATKPPTIADLLGRPTVNLDTPELQRFLAGKRIVVTGAGGSIGSEICRQAMRFCPQRMVLIERAENALFEIDRELRERWVGADIRPNLIDVCDERKIRDLFERESAHVVFHAAAHKHVPMMESHPGEAIRNNVFGTKTVADAAGIAGAQAFVLISTDKAVNPSSVMGATKRVAELYVQSLNGGESDEATKRRSDEGRGGTRGAGSTSQSAPPSSLRRFVAPSLLPSPPSLRRSVAPSLGSTRFLAVRFGNVLGSSGSVVPIFQRQIEAGGPVTVTHPEMRRYFMTIPEASQLVMQAGAIGNGGEVFVLDMGQPVRILDLARELIRRNGLKPDVDIPIRFSGVRPGEKLFEELACDDEQTCGTSHDRIRVWQLPPVTPREVQAGLSILSDAMESTPDQAVAALMQCVPEYKPARKDVPHLRIATEADAAEEAAA